MGERRTYEQLVCDWSQHHSISKIWSVNQHHLQERYRIPVTNGNIPHHTCPNFTKMSSQSLGKKGKRVYCKHLYYVFNFFCKVDYDSDKYNHAPTYSKEKVLSKKDQTSNPQFCPSLRDFTDNPNGLSFFLCVLME